LIQAAQGMMQSGSSGGGGSGSTGTGSTKQQLSGDDLTKGKSPSKTLDSQQTQTARVNLFKVQQGFGILNVCLAQTCLTLLTELMLDLKIETLTGEEDFSDKSTIEPAGFDIMGHYVSSQRIVRVLNCATLQQLLTFLATVSYRKACTLKRINTKNPNEGGAGGVGEQISYSDSTTYFNDTFSISEESEESEDEDSESYLGLWFKETLSPESNDEGGAESSDGDKKDGGDKKISSNLVPAKDEPHEYLELAAQIFLFLDQSLGGQHKILIKFIRSGLSEQQMVLLANILKDLDRDSARGEPMTSVAATDPAASQWQQAMVKFSGSLGKYLHNLMTSGSLKESLQSALLLHLGVSPWTEENTMWPLQVYPRTLAVLIQILLLKPSQEKEAACLSVWHRLVNTLVEGVCSTPPSGVSSDVPVEYEDLNVEHAQLLLFLFHALNLMQKKSILLLTAGGVIRCADVCRNVTAAKPLRDNQLMLLSRLLLFLEYLMKHLYNPPNILLEQVRWNLFSIFTFESASEQKSSDLINYNTKMMSFCRKDIEDKFRKFMASAAAANGGEIGSAASVAAGGVKPKFYSLTTIDTKIQQEFKLDGLAWNFILCTPDKLKYPLLIDALIDILSVTDMCLAKIPFQTQCAVHYCFSLCWKLLLGLPPSTQHVESLMQEKVPNLHSLLWSIRCLPPITHSHYLIVNSLVKQGMYTQSAEHLWNRLTDHVADIKYSLKLTVYGLEAFIKTFLMREYFHIFQLDPEFTVFLSRNPSSLKNHPVGRTGLTFVRHMLGRKGGHQRETHQIHIDHFDH
jgi:E3 ubiquitin-protein ligase UBR4